MPEAETSSAIQFAVRQTARELNIDAADHKPVPELVVEIRGRSETTYDFLAKFIERQNAFRGYSEWYDVRRLLGPMDEFFELYRADLQNHVDQSRQVLVKHLAEPRPDAAIERPANLLS